MNKLSRRAFLGCGVLALAALIYYLLDRLWYAAAPRNSPRWFDDSRDWQQMDKAGHAFSAYHLSRLAHRLLLWAGIAPEKSHHYAALLGFAALSPIELLDSLASTHGASAYDLLANATGAALFTAQEQVAGKQLLRPKFWFAPSPYAVLRPDKLGSNLGEQFIKDYNGQSYWLSFPMPFLPADYQWIRAAVGYGATGMVYGNPDQNRHAGYQSRRHFFLGLDAELPARLQQKNAGKIIGFLSEMFRLPLPKVER
ncbi:DUF2279 domain-containing protein [Rhodoflexus sp.]